MEGLNVNEVAAPIDYSILETKPRNLNEAIEHTALIFSRGFDEVEAAKARAEVSRVEYVNFVIDFAKADGMSNEGILDMVDTLILKPAVEGGTLSKASRYQYRSGLGKALAHGVAYESKSFELPAVEVPGKATRGRKKAKPETKAVTEGSMKIDRRGRKVEMVLGKSTDLDMFEQAVSAILAEPGNMTLFLAYAKSHGWIKTSSK